MAFNREEWFHLAVKKLTPLFVLAGADIPRDLYISVGRTTHRMGEPGIVAETWHGADSDGAIQIFISPTLNDTLEVLAVLTHELVHAALGPNEGIGHGKAFRKLSSEVGLCPPWTQSVPSQQLEEYFVNEVICSIGKYYQPEFKTADFKTPGSRLLKVVCPSCGSIWRASYKSIERGLPICGNYECDRVRMEMA